MCCQSLGLSPSALPRHTVTIKFISLMATQWQVLTGGWLVGLSSRLRIKKQSWQPDAYFDHVQALYLLGVTLSWVHSCLSQDLLDPAKIIKKLQLGPIRNDFYATSGWGSCKRIWIRGTATWPKPWPPSRGSKGSWKRPRYAIKSALLP